MMKYLNNLVWREVTWHRPFEIDSVYEVLTHLASLSSRSFIVWEARCKAGRVRYLIGTGPKTVSRVQEVFKSHGDVTFSTEAPEREAVNSSVKLKTSKPVLSLNTDTTAAMIRATLAAMTGAKSDALNPEKRLSISPKDSLEHTVLLGPTGAGKSTAMEKLILSDIKAGRSVLVIDPKADLVTSILERIPDERKEDVVVIDPSDPCPVGFNPLAFRRDPSQTVDAILAVFQELFSQNWGIRSADVLAGALLTLVQIKGATLLWLPQLLTDEVFRKKITAQVNDPIALNPFWEHYNAMRDSERRTEIAPVLNKLRQITYRPGLRNVLGQSEPNFSLADLFLKRKVVLVPLNRGLVGAESARLLGSLIVGLTWSLALTRANIAPEKRHTVSIFIDELQDYLALPTSFSDALAQARGLGVGYTVAHQYRGQLPPDIRAGIDANTRNKIVFGLNSDDAKDMAAQAPELEALDFMTLPRYQIYTTFQCSGRSTGWISGKTQPPEPALRMAAELKAESAKRYGVPAEQTEQALIKMLRPAEEKPAAEVVNTTIGRRRI